MANSWQKLKTVLVLTKLSTRRFFRDKIALFFGILFPLIFLFVFGSFSSNSSVTFNVAVINHSNSAFSKTFVNDINHTKVFKVHSSVKNLKMAITRMSKSQLDGTIVLPKNFGQKNNFGIPSGHAQVIYTENNTMAGQTLTAILKNIFNKINIQYIKEPLPFKVVSMPLRKKSLTSFDYIFSGLLGFSIVGMGIFGPVNVFPELKKQGILRRLHTTPLKVWQYFTATMFSQAITGIVSISIQFLVAITVFHLKVNGNYLDIGLFTILSIAMILGIGLAIGGWAKNERQAAPLSNIIVFPMLFLSGSFFPRYEMPHWLQSITTYLPLTPVVDGLRMLTTEGKNLLQIGPQLGLVLIWFVIIYIIAFRVFRWE